MRMETSHRGWGMRRHLGGLLVVCLLVVGAGSAEALGSDEGDQPAPLVWTRLGRPLGGGTAYDYVTLPDGSMLAVGSLGDSARVWHSADGITWDEVRPPGQRNAWVSSVAAAAHGIVATGTRTDPERGTGQGVVWTSEDGLDWSERHTFPGATPVEAIATRDGYAVVTQEIPADETTRVSVWHSATGEEWEASPVYDSQGEIVFVGAAAHAAAGAWVIVGMDSGTSEPRLWRSDDGRTWEASEWAAQDPHWVGGPLVATPTGFLLGLVRPRGLPADDADLAPQSTIWHSLDGRDWTEVATSEEAIVAMTAGPTGVLALAEPFERGGPKSDWPVSVLRSRDGFDWTAEEVPALKGLPMKRLVAMPGGRVLAIRELRDITWLGQPADAPQVSIPEPTPSGHAPALDFKALVNQRGHPDGDFDEVAADIVEYFEMMGDELDPVDLATPAIDELLRWCKRIIVRDRDGNECVVAFSRLHQAYGLTRDPRLYELADRLLGVTMNDERAPYYKPLLRERIKWNIGSYPAWFKD